jgi:RNA polymerase sigma factor (sigma-70 family)
MVQGQLVEATALPASVGLGRGRIAISASFLRLLPDEQLVTLFRDGSEDAFRAIHDRYRARLFAYTRQMLNGTGQDPEDAVQDIFTRAYFNLRANRRELALRAWLYRIAHNRCIDELRRPHPVALEMIDTAAPGAHDPVTKVEQRDALRRLIADVRRLPDQQRSALLMRELSGMPYIDVAAALGVSVAAVKSLLVRARISLAEASDARDTACGEIREQLIDAHDRGVRASGLARRHMRDCGECRHFRTEMRGVTRNLAALTPTLGPLGVIANLLGWGSGTSAVAGTATAGSGAAAAGGAAGSGAAASAGLLAGGAGHVVTLLAAAVVTAGGAVELQHSLASSHAHHAHHHAVLAAPAHRLAAHHPARASASRSATRKHATKHTSRARAASTTTRRQPIVSSSAQSKAPAGATHATKVTAKASNSGNGLPISERLDPDNLIYTTNKTTSVTNPSSGSTADGPLPATATPSASNPADATGSTPGTETSTTTPSGTVTGTPTSSASPSTTGSPTGTPTVTTAPADPATGSSPPTSTGTDSGTVNGATPAVSAPASTGTSATSSTQTAAASVGATTNKATKHKVISFMLKRHVRHHRRVVGGLISSTG